MAKDILSQRQLAAQTDTNTIQKLANHAQVTTATRYDRRGERAKRKVVSLLHVPYTRSSSIGN